VAVEKGPGAVISIVSAPKMRESGGKMGKFYFGGPNF
jgi:hypothetical protein